MRRSMNLDLTKIQRRAKFKESFVGCGSVPWWVGLGPRGGLLLVSDGGSDIFWVCKTLSSIPLGTRFGA